MNTTKYILTIGLNDKDTKQQKYDTITAYKMIEQIALNYVDGTSITEQHGTYKHEDGTITHETSLQLSLMFTNDLTVKLIANEIKKALNQESIIFEKLTSNSILI